MNKYIVNKGLVFSEYPTLDLPDLLFIGIEWVIVEAISDKDAIYQANLFKEGKHPRQKDLAITFEKVRFLDNKSRAKIILIKDLFSPPDTDGFVLEIEAIGYTSYRAKNNYSKKRYWVAEVTDIDQKFGLKRKFIEGKKDFARANKRANRGVYLYYLLNQYKIYEVSAPISTNHIDRYFCYIDHGKEIRIPKQEVISWLKGD